MYTNYMVDNEHPCALSRQCKYYSGADTQHLNVQWKQILHIDSKSKALVDLKPEYVNHKIPNNGNVSAVKKGEETIETAICTIKAISDLIIFA
jgi:hypothetical protein